MIWEIEQKMYRNTIALYNRLETVEFQSLEKDRASKKPFQLAPIVAYAKGIKAIKHHDSQEKSLIILNSHLF